MQAAVIGVGVMGGAIAGRLLDVGVTVAVYDVAPDKCRSSRGHTNVTGLDSDPELPKEDPR